jgi:hypothetical protein
VVRALNHTNSQEFGGVGMVGWWAGARLFVPGVYFGKICFASHLGKDPQNETYPFH